MIGIVSHANLFRGIHKVKASPSDKSEMITIAKEGYKMRCTLCVCVSGRTQIGVSKSKCHLSLCTCDSFCCVSTSYWLSAFQRHHSKFICKHESHRSFYSSHCCLQLKPHLLTARWLFLFHRVSVHRQPNVYHGVAWLCLSSAVRNVKLAYKINLLLTKLSLIYNKVDYVT